MPNHTQNRVVVSGNLERVEELIAAVRTEHPEKEVSLLSGDGTRVREAWVDHFDFEKIIPKPPCVLVNDALTSEDQARYRGRNWLDWNRRKWGTKWNSYQHRPPVVTVVPPESNHAIAVFRFQTAWNAPTPVFLELASMFPELSFTADSICEGWNFAFTDVFAWEEVPHDREKMVRARRTSFDCSRDNVVFRTFYECVYGEPIPEEEE